MLFWNTTWFLKLCWQSPWDNQDNKLQEPKVGVLQFEVKILHPAWYFLCCAFLIICLCERKADDDCKNVLVGIISLFGDKVLWVEGGRGKGHSKELNRCCHCCYCTTEPGQALASCNGHQDRHRPAHWYAKHFFVWLVTFPSEILESLRPREN